MAQAVDVFKETRVDAKEEFMEYANRVKREGWDELMEYLELTDFFEAPASTVFHGNVPGWLAQHSVNLTKIALQKLKMYKKKFPELTEENIIVAGLLHDLCKIGVYKMGSRNVKNETTGQWEARPTWKFEENWHMGHATKSLLLIQKYIKLEESEMMMIRWHMGPWSDTTTEKAYRQALEKYPFIILIHTADLETAAILEPYYDVFA